MRDCLLAGTNTLGEPAAVLFDGDAIRAAMPWVATWPYMIDVATYAKVLAHGSVSATRPCWPPSGCPRTRGARRCWTSSRSSSAGWRDDVVASGLVPFSGVDRLRSEAALRVRTAARRVYFTRVARRAGKTG